MAAQGSNQYQGTKAVEYLRQQELENCIGHTYRITGLKSEVGQKLNGKLCRVIDRQRNPPTSNRLAVRLLEDLLQEEKASGEEEKQKKNVLALQYGNLCDPLLIPDQQANYLPDPIPDEELRVYLANAVVKHQGPSRPDIVARCQLLNHAIRPSSSKAVKGAQKWKGKEYRKKSEAQKANKEGGAGGNGNGLGDWYIPTGMRCGDPLCADKKDSFVQQLQMSKPACVGNGKVDLSHFNEGLMGNGAECTICLQTIEKNSLDVIGLPCLHVFHRPCLSQWLSRTDVCPICRFELAINGRAYMAEFDPITQLRMRLNEWPVSGFCHKCQASYMERDPLVQLPNPNGGDPILVPQSRIKEMYGPTGGAYYS